MKRSSLNRAEAKQNPESAFARPFDIVFETLFTKGEKIGTLNRWRDNILEGGSLRHGRTSEHERLLVEIDEAVGQLSRGLVEVRRPVPTS